MRVTTLLRELLGLCSTMVIVAWELPARSAGDRPHLVLKVRRRPLARSCARRGA